jgi:hypothetical protein
MPRQALCLAVVFVIFIGVVNALKGHKSWSDEDDFKTLGVFYYEKNGELILDVKLLVCVSFHIIPLFRFLPSHHSICFHLLLYVAL